MTKNNCVHCTFNKKGEFRNFHTTKQKTNNDKTAQFYQFATKSRTEKCVAMNKFPLQPICKCWAPNLKITQFINEFVSKVEDKNEKRCQFGAKQFLKGNRSKENEGPSHRRH